MAGKQIPLERRYWPKVAVRGVDECWPWIAAISTTGYGRIGAPGRGSGMLEAHRVAWTLAHGPIPPGMEVCHACDNPPCQNPGHLFLGTHADNMHDRDAKGRLRGGPGHVHGVRFRPRSVA